VYEQDRAGNYISLTRADRLSPAKIDDYRTAVWNFIDNIRMVTLPAPVCHFWPIPMAACSCGVRDGSLLEKY
ncbi:hypothetical protein ACSLN1_26220, partial [Escherichia coli]